jgi:uncharacterized protein YecT (DUF1311 family)
MRKFGFFIAFMLFASPASAINCASAISEPEKAICSDPEARSADEALGKAYVRLRNSLSSDEAAALRHSQIKWIGDRDRMCSDASKADKPLSRCLTEQSRQRLRFLDGKPRAGDVVMSFFRPMFVFRPAKNGSASLSIQAIKFIGDGAWQSKLNGKIEAMVKDALSDAEAGKDNPGSHENYFVDLDIDLAYASPQMVSVQVDSGSYLGQAHPLSANYNINLDIGASRELTFDNFLDGTKAKQVFELCRSQVAKQKLERGDADNQKDDVELEEVTQATKAFSNWRFGSSSVDIYYGVYAFGGYGRCVCTCTIPYSMLRPLAKKEFPLP